MSAIPPERKMEKNLELLYDYTKFHIGTYTTLATLYIGIANTKFTGFCLILNHFFYTIAVLALLVAGMAGGTIVSSITQSTALDSNTFLNGEDIGPWAPSWLKFKAIVWTRIEHISFWIAVAAAIVSIGETTSITACSGQSSAAVQRFGHAVVVNLVGLLGYYAMFAMTLNTFEMRANGQTELPFIE